MSETQIVPRPTRSNFVMAHVILLCCLIAVVAVAHHPVASGRSSADTITSIRALSASDQAVHGSILIVMTLLTGAMAQFSLALGLRRPAALVAMVAFALSLIFDALAMSVDGFVIPAIAVRCDIALPQCANMVETMLRYASIEVQVFTRMGLFATAGAVLLWSVELLHRAPRLKLVGVIGLLSFAAQILFLFGSAMVLSPQSVMHVFLAQVVFYLAAAALMLGWFGLKLIEA